MAPPPLYDVIPPYVSLIVRILTFICLLISLVLLTTASETVIDLDTEDVYRVKFKDFKAFRYLCATAVTGLAYTLSQTTSLVVQVTTGNRFGGDNAAYIDFIGDKIVSYILATGAAASFGMSQEFKDSFGGTSRFIQVTNAATSLCFIAFVFTAISSVFSSLALPKKSVQV